MLEPVRVPPSPSLRRYARDTGFSAELLARWDLFFPDVVGLVEALAKPPARYLRMNPLRGSPEDTIDRLHSKGFEMAPTTLVNAYRVLDAPVSPGATDEYLLGRYQLQDISSQLAGMAVDAKPGQRVADLAAAPGGKTIQLAQSMGNSGAVHAFELDRERSRSLVSNLARCGVRNTAVFVGPGQDVPPQGEFDHVLVDAPCTGEGVIQRDPSRKRIHLGEYASCAATQQELLQAAIAAVRPGGTVVYSTCTLAPEENEMQLDRLVQQGTIEVVPLPDAIDVTKPSGEPLVPGLTQVGSVNLDPSMRHARRTFPHLHGCMGFFVASVRRTEGSA